MAVDTRREQPAPLDDPQQPQAKHRHARREEAQLELYVAPYLRDEQPVQEVKVPKWAVHQPKDEQPLQVRRGKRLPRLRRQEQVGAQRRNEEEPDTP